MSEVEEKQINEKTEKAKKAKNRTSLKNIIGGDILATDFFRRQTKLLVMIMLLIIFYIHNRYACQQQMIEIDKLKKEVKNGLPEDVEKVENFSEKNLF